MERFDATETEAMGLTSASDGVVQPGTAVATAAPPARGARVDEPEPLFDLIELMFFAYRDFVGDADRLLDAYGFGRAHHRVLHFVNRRPGLTVADLLDILKITKQSLNRVMKDLLDGGLIVVRAGTSDRRRRLLFASPEGVRLALDLARLQSSRFRAALASLPPGAREGAAAFLLAVADPDEQERIAAAVQRRLPRVAREPGP